MRKRIILILLMIMLALISVSVVAAPLTADDLPASAVTAASAVNLRASAYAKGKIVTKLSNGSPITVVALATAKDGTLWYEVNTADGYHGFIRYDLVSTDADQIEAVKTQQKSAEKSKQKSSGSGSYIGNKNSKVFHKSGCSHLPKSKNRVYFSDRSKAVSSGYRPCSYCKP